MVHLDGDAGRMKGWTQRASPVIRVLPAHRMSTFFSSTDFPKIESIDTDIGKAVPHGMMKVCIDCLRNTLKMVRGEKII
jgi:hypothetical protein